MIYFSITSLVNTTCWSKEKCLKNSIFELIWTKGKKWAFIVIWSSKNKNAVADDDDEMLNFDFVSFLFSSGNCKKTSSGHMLQVNIFFSFTYFTFFLTFFPYFFS